MGRGIKRVFPSFAIKDLSEGCFQLNLPVYSDDLGEETVYDVWICEGPDNYICWMDIVTGI